MEKKNRFKNFIKRDGFYVILFVCLCVVATVAAVTAKKVIKPNTKPPVADASIEIKDSEKSPTTQMPDATLVKENEGKEKAVKAPEKTSTVSNTNKVTFVSPTANGVISKAYSTAPVSTQKDSSEKRNLHGVNLEAKVGTPVTAAADGKVTESGEASNYDLGFYVKIKHADQSVTVYANLDPALKVKVGDVVKQKQIIGKVGQTAQNYDKEIFGEFLIFRVDNAKGEEIDPKSCISSLTVNK